jgi:hypothetical protein
MDRLVAPEVGLPLTRSFFLPYSVTHGPTRTERHGPRLLSEGDCSVREVGLSINECGFGYPIIFARRDRYAREWATSSRK